MPYAGLNCSCCGGETDANGDCPSYCEPDPCPCPVAQKRRTNASVLAPEKIEPRIPRPLKRSEKKRLREREGGDATAEMLASLEEKFQREHAKKRHPSHDDFEPSSSSTNNGWER